MEIDEGLLLDVAHLKAAGPRLRPWLLNVERERRVPPWPTVAGTGEGYGTLGV